MFERFTERARQVVCLAQEEAREFKHGYIGTEHVLLGLLREEEGLAAHVLESLGVTVDRVRAQVNRIVGLGETTVSDQIPFTPRAKIVLEEALREALALGHKYIGTEHILLGLVRDPLTGTVMHILTELIGVDYADSISADVVRALSGPGRAYTKTSAAEVKPDKLTLTLSSDEAWSLYDLIPQGRVTGIKNRLRRLIEGGE